MCLDLRRIRCWIKPLFIFSLILLALVFVPYLGKEVGGAKRWLKIGVFSFQPSELAKWASILFLADFLSSQKKKPVSFFRHFLFSIMTVGIPCLLILMQPDLGGAFVLGVVAMFIFFAAGINLSYIITLILVSLPVFYFSIFSVPYRRRRIFAFLNPWADVRGYGFQIVQSYLALGLGGLWGAGLGKSTQKLFYLPAAQTDFIFSIIGEELGLIGTVSIVILFILFLWQGIKISLRSSDTFIKLLSFGIVVTIVLTASVHIAVVCGAVPTKGLPLPFISYGGSALVLNMMAVGLLLNSSRDRYFQDFQEKRL
jgi:cell division protein FtsW